MSVAQPLSPTPGAAEVAAQWQERLGALLDTRRFRRRFVAIYLLLALILGGSVAGAIAMGLGLWGGPPAVWSSWTPRKGRTGSEIHAIARHVATAYRSGNGRVASVTATSPPAATNGHQRSEVTTVFVEPGPKSKGGVATIDTGRTVMYMLCGHGPACASAGGIGQRRAVRREALELALLTLKYVPGIDSILAIPPPSRSVGPPEALFFERPVLAKQLAAPLRKTLSLARSPFGLDALTLPDLYRYRLTQMPVGGLGLVLQPVRRGAGL